MGHDAHAHSKKTYAFASATGEIERKSLGYEPGELASWTKPLPQPARYVYESSVSGFHPYCALSNGILAETDEIKGEVNRP